MERSQELVLWRDNKIDGRHDVLVGDVLDNFAELYRGHGDDEHPYFYDGVGRLMNDLSERGETIALPSFDTPRALQQRNSEFTCSDTEWDELDATAQAIWYDR